MSRATEHAVSALRAVAGEEPTVQSQVEGWVAALQESGSCWEVCDQILGARDVPARLRFVAGQTLRLLLQHDFDELPAEDHARLRDAFLGRIEQEQEMAREASEELLSSLFDGLADLLVLADGAEHIAAAFERWGRGTQKQGLLVGLLALVPNASAAKHLAIDSDRRADSRARLRKSTPEVLSLLGAADEAVATKRKTLLRCLLAWVCFTKEHGDELAALPLLADCFGLVAEAGDECEVASQVIVEALRLCSLDLESFRPLVLVLSSRLLEARPSFEALIESGDLRTLGAQKRVCKIYAEAGLQLLPDVIGCGAGEGQYSDVLQMILKCTDTALPETSSLTFEFWQALKEGLLKRSSSKEGFAAVFEALLRIVLRRCALDPAQDRFWCDEDVLGHRGDLIEVLEACLAILPPGRAFELVLADLDRLSADDALAREARLACLAALGSHLDAPGLDAFIESTLLPLVRAPLSAEEEDAGCLYLLRRSALDLLGRLWRLRPELMGTVVDVVSKTLLRTRPFGCSAAAKSCAELLDESAAELCKDLCRARLEKLGGEVPALVELCTRGLSLPLQIHTLVIQGSGAVINSIGDDDAFWGSLDPIATAFVEHAAGADAECVAGSLDRLTTIVREITVKEGSPRYAKVGGLVNETLWPLVKAALATHAGDSHAVEKCCRLLKHSMRCTPAAFKDSVADVVDTLLGAAKSGQLHSSYLYSAEVLGCEYGSDEALLPLLENLFAALSDAAVQRILAGGATDVEAHTELIEDLFGMFGRYLRYAPSVVVQSTTLPAAVDLLPTVLAVRQRDAMESVVGFVEHVLELGAEQSRDNASLAEALRPHARQSAPLILAAVARLLAWSPARCLKEEGLPRLLEGFREAFPDDVVAWLSAALAQLPQPIAAWAEQHCVAARLVRGDSEVVDGIIKEICGHCELLAAWSARASKSRDQDKDPESEGSTEGSTESTDADQ